MVKLLKTMAIYIFLEKHKVGDVVELEILRNQKKINLKLTLEEGQ